MSVTNVDSYVSYFRSMAVAHRDLQHDPASETGDAPVGSKRFARWSPDEIVSGLRSKVAFPALLIELYEVDTAGGSAYDVKPVTSGAFTVLEHAGPNNYNEEQAAYSLAEKIVYDILKQMWQDHHGATAGMCDSPFRKVNFNKINITPVGPLFDNEFGWRVMFEFELQQQFDIKEAPAAGVFIN